MNGRMPPLQQPSIDPDVTLECERAIDGAVRELVDKAVTAGWPPEAAFKAIRRVTERQASAYQEDPDPADDPVEARARIGFSLAPF
jgi:hypothetical protein